MRVLVIDDDTILANLLKLTLELDGFDVAVAHDGGAGLTRLREQRFDLVILDLVMPNVDGVRFLRMLAETDAPRPRVMVLSSAIEEGVTEAWRALGVVDVARKPVEPGELVERARRALDTDPS